jgi:hypothetical protein
MLNPNILSYSKLSIIQILVNIVGIIVITVHTIAKNTLPLSASLQGIPVTAWPVRNHANVSTTAHHNGI